MTVSMVTGEAVYCGTVGSLEEKERAAEMVTQRGQNILNAAMH